VKSIEDVITSLQEAKNGLEYLDLEGNGNDEIADLIDEAIEKLEDATVKPSEDDEDDED
jgi:hypothetical protein